MVARLVDLELPVHGASELRLRQHAAHRFFDDPGGVLLADHLCAFLAQATFVPAVVPVQLLFFLLARQSHARRVQDDHMIALIEERRPAGLVFSLKQASRLGRHAPQHLALCIDNVPLPLYCHGRGPARRHYPPFQPNQRNGKPKSYGPIEKLSMTDRCGTQIQRHPPVSAALTEVSPSRQQSADRRVFRRRSARRPRSPTSMQGRLRLGLALALLEAAQLLGSAFRPPGVGLGTGSSAVKAVVLRRGRGGWALVAAGETPIPEGSLQDGAAAEPTIVSEAVSGLLDSLRLKRARVSAALSGHAVIVKRLSLPAMSQ